MHLVLVQFALGLFTVITDRAADVATAHVAVGSLTLALGCWFSWAVRAQQATRGDIAFRSPLETGLPQSPAVG